ncbi:MAG: ABC transporter substrate-binding protein, partial [Coriobacteriales bacterium]|nr:ABC transporter substrate-binding protein [Coriobacteriales bacterium]
MKAHTKKALAFALAAVLALGLMLSGCGGDAGSTTPQTGGSGSGETPATLTDGDLGLITQGKLTVGSDCDYPPLIYLEGDKPLGFEFELLDAIATDLGLTLEFLPPQNFDTLVTQVQGGGKMDLAVSSLTITDDRLKSIDFCTPYFDSNQAVVTLTSSALTSSADLAGKTIGAQSGTTGEMWSNENIPGATVKSYNQASEGLAALQAGDIEALIFDEPVAFYQVNKTYTDCQIVEVIPTGEQYGFAVSKENPALKEAVN